MGRLEMAILGFAFWLVTFGVVTELDKRGLHTGLSWLVGLVVALVAVILLARLYIWLLIG